MLKRIITAAVCLAVFIPALIFSEVVPLFFLSIIAILAVLSVYEICGCFGVRKAFYISFPSVAVTAAVMVLGIIYSQQYSQISFERFASIIFAMLFAYLFIIFASATFSNGGVRFSQVCETAAVTAYILIGFLTMIFTRYSDMGKYNLLLIFIGVWLTDSGAYFVGSFLGKHKLIPEVSPKKTVEGAFGGIFGCVLGYVIYALILQFAFDISVNYIYLIVLAILVSIIDQIGDLLASFIKREQGIKDFGFIFPGHGGVMDRFDSALAVSPFIFFLLCFVKTAIFSI